MPAIIKRECIGGGIKLDYDDSIPLPKPFTGGLEIEDPEIQILLQLLRFCLSEKTEREVRNLAIYFGIPEDAADTLIERIDIALCQ